jgi:formate hydrogenlyase transcriptional activator
MASEPTQMPAESSRDGARARDTERYRTLLEITNAVISNLTRDALFHAIAEALRSVVPFARTAIFLHDPDKQVLRLFVLESSLPSDYFTVGLEMGAGESHVGRVFQTRRPMLRHDLEVEREYPMEDRALADGVRSYVIVPLVARGTAVGVLAVASTRANQYSEADAAFLQEAASQIALAVENMKAYEDISALNRALEREVVRRSQAEAVLRAITEGTASVTGSDFFYSLVRHLAAALGVRYVFVTEYGDERAGRLRTRAVWTGDRIGENFEYDVALTPCRAVVEGTAGYHCRDLQKLFPHDKVLVEFAAESYVGIPLVGSSGRVIGLLTVLDDKPMADPPAGLSVLQVFASRAGAELERLRAEEALQTALTEVERLRAQLHAENVYLQEEIRGQHNFVEMVGSSPALLEALRKVEQVARTDSTVLIAGETGTGKELVARAIHDRSARRERPLVKVDCSAISAGLVESELFGHVKGAFTGALERRIGRFELADGGTIFLDEVGELAPETQVKLLRVLQEQEFEPVGSNRTVRVDVRVIAATNRDLAEAVRAGRFRADLFYRLNVFPVELPPLRERRSDIPQLVTFFLGRFSKRFGKPMETVAPDTMERLLRYSWPGNIRELQNVVERAVILASRPVLELDADLAPAASAAPTAESPRSPDEAATSLPSLEDVERGHILAALRQTDGVIEGARGAARILKLHPNTLRSRMEKLGIKRPRHDRP